MVGMRMCRFDSLRNGSEREIVRQILISPTEKTESLIRICHRYHYPHMEQRKLME